MFFFFNDTATTEIYTLSLHDALPISTLASATATLLVARHPYCRRAHRSLRSLRAGRWDLEVPAPGAKASQRDRKSTRLNSSHVRISYAVFCLKKKKKKTHQIFHVHDG